MKLSIQEYSYFVFQLLGFGMMSIFAIEAMLKSIIQVMREIRRMWEKE